MEKVITICLVTLLLSISAAEENKDDLVVPQPVMEFIMDCRKSRQDEQLIPVLRTNIDVDGGTTSQQVSLLGIDELHTSLKSAIESEDVTDHIIGRIRDKFLRSGPTFRTEECPPTTNTIHIAVPPQEVKVFHQRMERVLQQNNNILLGQVNDMITAKFASIQRSLEDIIKQRTKHINENVMKLSERVAAPNNSSKLQMEDFEQQEQPHSESVESSKISNSHNEQQTEDELGPTDEDILAQIMSGLQDSYKEEEEADMTTDEVITEIPAPTTSVPVIVPESGNGSLPSVTMTPEDTQQKREDSSINTLSQLLRGTKFDFADG